MNLFFQKLGFGTKPKESLPPEAKIEQAILTPDNIDKTLINLNEIVKEYEAMNTNISAAIVNNTKLKTIKNSEDSLVNEREVNLQKLQAEILKCIEQANQDIANANKKGGTRKRRKNKKHKKHKKKTLKY
jgi:hypothetical protein